ncbi:MAG: putative nucleic acid-binding Zn-ribbon protein, partial [Bradymonadia bacterium]
GPLSRIKSSGPYTELCRMWQGAKEGGADSRAMKAAFNREFDNRGFWGSTEEAFDLVQSAAKRDARPEAEAEAARGEADAASDAVTSAENALNEADAGGPAGRAAGAAGPASGGDPRMAALMGASVEAEAPDLGSFAELSQVSDEQVDAIMGESRHFDSFSDRAAGGEFQGRVDQVFTTLGENLLGGAVKGGTDTLLDGLVYDQVGFFGDQGLKLATSGRLNTPMIGPIIGMVQAPPWQASSWGTEQASAAFDSFGEMGDSWDAFQNAEGTDAVGAFCALLADLFGGLRDLLDAIATFCGTLSAVCYVLGGLMILFGIALLWLAGVGAPIITAGGWMTRAGGILGRINSALGPIVLVLSGITIFFRTLAALMVPAEMYADQLADVGTSANNFGEKAGARAADTAVGAVNDRLQAPIADRVNDRVQDGADGGDNGANVDADEVVRDLDDADAALQDDLANDVTDDAPDADLDRPVDGDDDPDRPRDDDAPPDTATPRGRFRAFVGRIGTRLRATKLGAAITDLGQLASDPRRAAMEGLSPQLRADFERKLDSRLREKTATLEAMRTELGDMGTDIDPADQAQLESDIGGATRQLERLRTQLDDTRVAITEAQALEALARRDREADEDKNDDTRTQSEEAEHLRSEKLRLTEEGAHLQSELDRVNDQLDTRRPEVQERVRAIQDEIVRLQTERATAQRGVDTAEAGARRAASERQSELQTEVDRLLGEMGESQDQAMRLEAQAVAAERAATLRTDADVAARQAETAQGQADGLRSTLEARVGQRIHLTDAEGRNANGLITREVVGFTDTGVIVAEGRAGTRRTVPFADIARPIGFRDAAQSYGEATATATTAQQTALSTRSQADGLDPTGSDPAALRTQAQQHRDGALGLLGDHEAAERAAQGDHTPQADLDRVRVAHTAAGELDTELRTSQQEIDGLNGEVTALTVDETRLAGEVRANTAAITTTDDGIRAAEADAVRAASGNAHYGATSRGSSANATGGIGSSNAVWGQWL